MRTLAVPLAVVALAALLPVHSQDRKESAPASPLYKVEIDIHDTGDADARTDRRYTMLLDDSRKGVFRVGNKVPVASGSFQPGVGSAGAVVNTQYTYLDIGVNIECTVHEVGGKVSLRGGLDLSTVVKHDGAPGAANLPNPTIGQTKLEIEATIELGRPTVVAAIDDPVTARKLQVEATVTKAN